MGHGLDEHLRIRVMVGVAMGYDDRIETLGVQTGPVREDEGAGSGGLRVLECPREQF